jgi:hypothetical protein
MAQHPAEGGPLQKAARAFNTELQATVLQGQEITAAIGVRGAKVAGVERPMDLEQPQRHATNAQQPGI